MSGCDYLKKKFSVAINANISQEKWDSIFGNYCKCEKPSITKGHFEVGKRCKVICNNCGRNIIVKGEKI